MIRYGMRHGVVDVTGSLAFYNDSVLKTPPKSGLNDRLLAQPPALLTTTSSYL